LSHGSTITLTAAADIGSIVAWSGNNQTCDVMITGDLTVGARFDKSFPWPLFWHCGRRVTVLCLPNDGKPTAAQEPVVRIEGTIVWLSSDGHTFGLRYL